jgi:predicted CXXCH cytochrome family protein
LKLHKPFEKGECQLCHAPHSADFPYNTKDKSGQLCFNCHADLEAEFDGLAHKHEPVLKNRCGDCHLSHGSEHENNLVKGQPELCLKCHSNVAKYWQKGVSHAPASKDCTICHAPHGSSHKAILKNGSSKNCKQCHELGDKSFINSHAGMKPSAKSCIGCHDPHGGPEKGLLYPVVHAPFNEGSCKPCHKGGGDK